jgi:hypothetical protein
MNICQETCVYVPGLVVNLVTKSGGIDDGQGDAGSFLIQLELCHPGVSIDSLR